MDTVFSGVSIPTTAMLSIAVLVSTFNVYISSSVSY